MDIKIFVLQLIEQLKRVEKKPILLSEDETIKKLHDELYFLSLTKNTKHNLNNIQNFLLLMQKEIGQWGVFSDADLVSANVPTDLIILDDYIGVSEEADDFCSNFSTSFDETSKVVEDVLVMCRKNQWQKEYVAFRKFLIENPITNRTELKKLQRDYHFDLFLSESLEKCYEVLPKEAEYFCDTCGWTLHKKGSRYICGKKTCREDYSLQTIEQNIIPTEMNLRVKKPILLSVVIPGLPELKLANELKAKGAIVELYPDLERLGDIKASYNNQDYCLDMKDYTDHKQLTKYLLTNKDMIKTPYIVVSESKTDLRKNRTPAYVKKVNTRLQEEGITAFKVYSCLDIKKLILGGK